MLLDLSLVTSVDAKDTSPERLAERCKAGHRESFDQLVQQFEERIFNYIFQLVRNRHDAEDLAQETFVKAYQSIGRYDPAFSFAPWLFTIAKRSAYSFWRSSRRRQVTSPQEEWETNDPAVLLEQSDEKASLWELAQKLKPKQYEALWLRYGEGFSIAEVARIMGTNQVHVKVLLHRARNELGERLRRAPTIPQCS